MAEESHKQMELFEKGEAPLQEDSPTHANAGRAFDSSSRNSLSSGTPGSVPKTSPSRDGSKEKERLLLKDREDRVRMLREKQSEERQRKLEELKSAAIQAQKFRETQEEERRKKIEEIKSKDCERRHQVEERKKQIVDAEMERRGNLLRRTQEREARIEAQRNAHRSSIGFAFGSSTPRLLEAETPYIFNSRRAASQVLLYHPMSASLTRSPATNTTSNGLQTNTNVGENETVVRRRLGTSHSVDRGMDPGDIMTQSLTSLSTHSRGRRRTDLIPTVPIHKDSPRTRSPAASSPSRPQSSMSQQSLSSHSTSSVTLRAKPTPRKPRPLSVAGSTPDRSGETTEQRQGRSADKKAGMPPTGRPPRAKSAGADNVLKDVKANSTENGSTTTPVPTPRRPPSTKSTPTNSPKDKPKIAPKPSLQKQASKPSPLQSPTNETPSPPQTPPLEEIKPEPTVEEAIEINQPKVENLLDSTEIPLINGIGNNNDEQLQPPSVKEVQSTKDDSSSPADANVPPKNDENLSTAIPAKPKITTEEEAKAVLAEKRRKAREQAEREAELERQRQEELKRLEEERIRREEEAQREWEEEVERQRKAEEERLQKAIEEQQKREEEEKLKKEEEAKLKAEREKAEQIAREEQEKLRKEAEEKFSREEEERAKRRKRVEDIMSRTRARDRAKKEGQANTPTQGDDMTSSFSESFQLKTEVTPSNNQKDVLNNEHKNDSVLASYEENRQQAIRVSSMTENQSLVDLDTIQTNGFNNHHYHVDIERDYHSNTGESIMDSECTTPDKEVSVPTIMHSLSGFDIMTPTKITSTSTSNYESTASSATNISNMGDHLSNEDNVNFNIVTTTNGIDNYPSHQDTGVTDLLS